MDQPTKLEFVLLCVITVAALWFIYDMCRTKMGIFEARLRLVVFFGACALVYTMVTEWPLNSHMSKELVGYGAGVAVFGALLYFGFLKKR